MESFIVMVSRNMTPIQETTEELTITHQWAGCMTFDDVSAEEDDEESE